MFPLVGTSGEAGDKATLWRLIMHQAKVERKAIEKKKKKRKDKKGKEKRREE